MTTDYKTSIVGIIDILGVSEMLSNPETAKRYSEAVASILQPIIGDKEEWCFVLPHVDEAREIEIFLSPTFSKGSTISFFSDSIVISVPVDTEDERDAKCRAILDCAETIKALQRSLLMLGLRSRGGISIGGLVHSGELIVGDGLVRAYDIERRQSITPRTVIDQALVDHLLVTAEEHFPVYQNRISHAIRQDEDGMFFVDYLTFCPTNGYCGLDFEFPDIIRRLESDIRDFPDQPWIHKIEWLLKYTLYSQSDAKSEKISPWDHAKNAFSRIFPRTNETLVTYLKSEDELNKLLSLHPSRTPELESIRRHEWPLGWRSVISPEGKSLLNAELIRELCPKHILYGKIANILGCFNYSDDTLFLLEDGRVAAVHLTWNLEDRPEWPWTVIYPSFSSWVAEWEGKKSRRRQARTVGNPSAPPDAATP